jgi:hypothetical protein
MTIHAKAGIGFAGFAKRIVEGDMQPQYWCAPVIDVMSQEIIERSIRQSRQYVPCSTKSIEEQREANKRLFDGH